MCPLCESIKRACTNTRTNAHYNLKHLPTQNMPARSRICVCVYVCKWLCRCEGTEANCIRLGCVRRSGRITGTVAWRAPPRIQMISICNKQQLGRAGARNPRCPCGGCPAASCCARRRSSSSSKSPVKQRFRFRARSGQWRRPSGSDSIRKA